VKGKRYRVGGVVKYFVKIRARGTFGINFTIFGFYLLSKRVWYGVVFTDSVACCFGTGVFRKSFCFMVLHELTFITEFILFAFLMVIALKLPASRSKSRCFAFLFLLLLAHSGTLFALHFYHEAHPSDLLLYHFPIDLPFAMLLAPGAYLYLSMLLGHIRRRWCCNLLYAFLLLLPSAIYFGSYAFWKLTEHVTLWNRHPGAVRLMVLLLNVQFGITTVVYLLLSCRKLYALRSAGYRLAIEGWQYNLRWLLPFFWLALACCCAYFVWSHLHQYNHTRVVAGLIISNLLILYLFVWWIWHSRLADGKVSEPADARVWIGEHDADACIRQLIQGMESSRIYLQPDCTMADVAAVCQVSVRQLSYLLNHHLKLKFVDFISYYRLRHVVTITGNQSHLAYTLEEMSRQCGFGSRSNFHRVVKLYTGQSPKAFLQQSNNAALSFNGGVLFDCLRVYLEE